jgi:hypothetical protein
MPKGSVAGPFTKKSNELDSSHFIYNIIINIYIYSKMQQYVLDPGGVIKHSTQIEQFTGDAINIIYQQQLVMDNSNSTIGFVNALKSRDRRLDKQNLFFYLFKYDYNSRLRKYKIVNIDKYMSTQAIFEKLIRNNNNCIYSATVAFNDAMVNYTKFMKVSNQSQSQSTPSWFSRTFGSKSTYDTMVKSVPPNAYLIMVAVTFAILQYELMFNQRCVELLQLFKKSHEKSWFDLKPPTIWDTTDTEYHTTIDTIIQWLQESHDSNANIMSFMRTIGVVDVLNKQFENTYGGSEEDFLNTKGNPRTVANFFQWDDLNRLVPPQLVPQQTAGRRRTKTIARKKRNAKNPSFRRR